MSSRRFFLALALIVGAAIAGLVGVLATRGPEARSELWFEVGKGMISIVAVGVLGAVLKLLSDAHQAHGDRMRQQQDFLSDKHRRLVATAHVIRNMPVLVEANRSVKTWSEQMLDAIAAGGELRAIRHEVVAGRHSANPPFQSAAADALAETLESMTSYIKWLSRDFADNKKALGETQRWAEQGGLDQEERLRRQDHVWEKLRAVPTVADMIGQSSSPPPDGFISYSGFFSSYEFSLDLITRASLSSRER
jgi:hypothetical protein